MEREPLASIFWQGNENVVLRFYISDFFRRMLKNQGSRIDEFLIKSFRVFGRV